MKNIHRGIVMLALGATVLTGCGKHTQGTAEQSAKAQVSAFATSSAAAYDKQQAIKIAKHCLPDTGTITGILQYKTLLSPSNGTADRAKVVACMGILQDQRPQFEQDLLSTGETALSNQLFKHQKGAIRTWVTVGVPELIVKYKYPQASPSPTSK